MAKDWIMVRISPDTHAALYRVRESMRRGEEQGQRELPIDNRDRVSLDAVIACLIAAYDGHAERRRRSAARGRSREGIETNRADTVIDPGEYPPDPLTAAPPLSPDVEVKHAVN
jgi:hypothetical protein